MRNAGLEETQAGIEIAGRNINNLRYADDTTLMVESEEELKSLLMKEGSEKVGSNLNIQKTKIMASGPITSCQIDGQTVETVADFILGGSKITADGDCSHEIKRCLLLVAQRLKHLPAIWETWVRSLGQEDPLEENMATHSSILTWRIPWTEEPGGLLSTGSQRVQQVAKWRTLLSD